MAGKTSKATDQIRDPWAMSTWALFGNDIRRQSLILIENQSDGWYVLVMCTHSLQGILVLMKYNNDLVSIS